MKRTPWFERTFPLIGDNGWLPSIIERLAGTPLRLEALISLQEPAALVFRRNDKWSVKEEAGHLSDLEPLWLGRLEDLINGSPELRAADLTNRQTHTADHNTTATEVLLQRFRERRQQLVDRLFQVEDVHLTNQALHPRLHTPMRIVDLAYFVAEHDDHHLAGIRENLRKYREAG